MSSKRIPKLKKISELENAKDLDIFIKNIHSKEFASPLAINLLVICGTLNTHLDLKYLYEEYEKRKNKDIFSLVLNDLIDEEKYYTDFDDLFKLKYNPKSKKSKTKKKRGNDTFYNCIVANLKINDENGKINNISIKLSSNGSIQYTGSRTIRIAHKVPKLITKFLYSYEKSILFPQFFNPNNLRIVMYNTIFKFNFSKNRKLNQEKVKNFINNNKILNSGKVVTGNKWISATFQPGSYPGVNSRFLNQSVIEKYTDENQNWIGPDISDSKKKTFKLEGKASVFIFSSGQVIITGVKEKETLIEAYYETVKIVKEHFDECTNPLLVYDSNTDSEIDDDIDL